jgi:hypothetical protein
MQCHFRAKIFGKAATSFLSIKNFSIDEDQPLRAINVVS